MQHFAPLDDLTQLEAEAANTRVFVGSGTPFLPVPGLLRLDAVRIGTQAMPLVEARSYPVAAGGRGHSQVSEPLLQQQNRADGTPVLVRSELSNSGIWQLGTKIYITGQWADENETGGAGELPPATESGPGRRARRGKT